MKHRILKLIVKSMILIWLHCQHHHGQWIPSIDRSIVVLVAEAQCRNKKVNSMIIIRKCHRHRIRQAGVRSAVPHRVHGRIGATVPVHHRHRQHLLWRAGNHPLHPIGPKVGRYGRLHCHPGSNRRMMTEHPRKGDQIKAIVIHSKRMNKNHDKFLLHHQKQMDQLYHPKKMNLLSYRKASYNDYHNRFIIIQNHLNHHKKVKYHDGNNNNLTTIFHQKILPSIQVMMMMFHLFIMMVLVAAAVLHQTQVQIVTINFKVQMTMSK
mmetsp:Transcript_4746/g.13675  ORF Transcript_4746/g.13675 Transcript_4746/m.13675 type:complete len:265 (-) Transcript_4746:710-1504(-)